MISVHDLPAVDAVLNATAAVLLVWGYTLIRRRKVAAHKKVMLCAFGVSVVFLICYLTYHFQVGVVRFQKTGMVRGLYLTILFTHTVLAAIVPFLAIITLTRALQGNFARHKRIARWTLPI
ncbi:MAG: DUF420 domain-containing protein, partial [Bryobacteraceae bacterium]